jgi:Predicted oxidoreductases (related to aryl-alcohol dehydrogenases)
VTPSQLALAWVLHQGNDIVPIPGTKHVKYLDENVGSIEIELSADDLRQLDEIAPPGAAAGMRYAEGGMATVNW